MARESRRSSKRHVSLLVDLPADAAGVISSVGAIEHAAEASGLDVEVHVLSTDSSAGLVAEPADGVFIGPGTPYRAPELAEAVILTARERGVPLVAT